MTSPAPTSGVGAGLGSAGGAPAVLAVAGSTPARGAMLSGSCWATVATAAAGLGVGLSF